MDSTTLAAAGPAAHPDRDDNTPPAWRAVEFKAINYSNCANTYLLLIVFSTLEHDPKLHNVGRPLHI